uniref:Uncharacterized protein n=1 Tax=Ditylenchus dipsaci TaxID=166011 RepID=A0A915ENF6_9BILA
MPSLHSFESYRSLGLGNQLFNGISKLKNLKYLSLYLGAGNEQHFMEALDSLAGVKALQFYGYINKDGKLFTDITSVGRLKHFDTNAHLSTDVVCQGISNCRPLKFLSWKKYQPIDYGLIFQTLDQMHKGEVEPRNSADPRILGIKLNKILIKKAPCHAYVKFYKTMQTSRVMRAAQFSQLSSVP